MTISKLDGEEQQKSCTLEEYLISKHNARQTQRGSIAEQMAYEVLQKAKPIKIIQPEKRVDQPIIRRPYTSVLDSIPKPYKENIEVFTKTECKRKDSKKIKQAAGTAFLYMQMGFFKACECIFGAVERKSIDYLGKTRPDIAEMMRKNEPFGKIAEQYFKKV